MPGKVSLAEKLALISEHWSPKIVGEPNGRIEDELFLVLRGSLAIHFRDGVVEAGRRAGSLRARARGAHARAARSDLA